MTKIPNQYEQEAARTYCLNRELIRPKTTFVTALQFLFFISAIIIITSYCFGHLFVWFGVSLSFSVLYFFATALVLFASKKKLLILLIELYQHYAPEQTRRKCTLKPSCSEYAIMALNKHGIFKALMIIHIRLFRTCNGIYSIDYP